MKSPTRPQWFFTLAALATPRFISAQVAIPSRGFNAVVAGLSSIVTIGGSPGGGTHSLVVDASGLFAQPDPYRGASLRNERNSMPIFRSNCRSAAGGDASQFPITVLCDLCGTRLHDGRRASNYVLLRIMNWAKGASWTLLEGRGTTKCQNTSDETIVYNDLWAVDLSVETIAPPVLVPASGIPPPLRVLACAAALGDDSVLVFGG
ncbi:hypothetical protein BDK51DRAFT_43989 [Blyttiomyces helicus]|uniref:Uncharacterized protein n=1 Tax=Blyttiomyces helicus TaxID=388810 RepID=A0A4P9WGY6_9FUNG|nr:hypothetical protein BDK51DRAFT_43989 [Blyttiomyces helicus]|eukprot:RKO91195.1 hypothetical protein BDK51DRAFT_43989 [Blyttiomyces helicus]